ncbi:hypothetical protein FOMPIDRAFT_1017838 [Fomitopsis schrenkii]|uniref:Uncharacterized protein n=1 Tax=Fomitopsis schrenkii TaxID=2126942 RepID=S8F9M3_FOMSC|nr:hypothetical protein FOMPIDRAFT_1017838 [Fomitopsis schrenkii]
MAKSPQKRGGAPNAATNRAPRGRPRKTQSSTIQAPSPQVATEGRIKREAVRRGRPATRRSPSVQEESSAESDDMSEDSDDASEAPDDAPEEPDDASEESDVELEEPGDESDEESDVAVDPVDLWKTVELWHGRQAQDVARRLSEDVDDIPPLVRNLHAHSSLRDVNDWSPPLTLHDVLGIYGKDVANALTKAGELQCLAIDMSLVAAGWLADSAARPSHVLLLQDTAMPGRSCALSVCPQVFKQATHVVVEPNWLYLRRVLPHPRSLFPALQYCCIQVDAFPPSADQTVTLVQELLRVRKLVKLVVCMQFGCTRDAPVWKALSALSATEEKLRVLPHGFGPGTEWQAVITGGSTVFNVPLVELQKRAAAIDSQDSGEGCTDLERSVSAWRFKPPSLQVSLSDAAVDREFSPFLADRLGAPSPDPRAVDGNQAPVVPGLPTTDDGFREMMSNHAGIWLP